MQCNPILLTPKDAFLALNRRELPFDGVWALSKPRLINGVSETVILHNAKSSFVELQDSGSQLPEDFEDIFIAARLIDENSGDDLESLAKRYLSKAELEVFNDVIGR